MREIQSLFAVKLDANTLFRVIILEKIVKLVLIFRPHGRQE